MIELIGVLAIIAILAAIVTPSAVQQISRAIGSKENRNLEILAEGLIRYINTYQTIPGYTTWMTNVASVTGLNVSEVIRVNPNNTTNTRVYLIHPTFTPANGANPLYSQEAAGANSVSDARLLILSTTLPTLALPVSSGRASSAPVFDAIWDWNYDPSTKAPPSDWPADWTNNAEHLHIQRINLSTLFQRLTFSNTQFSTNIPFAKFGNLSTSDFSLTNAVEAFYLQGTVVRLYKHDSPYDGTPPSDPDELDVVHTVERSANFVYQSGQWTMW